MGMEAGLGTAQAHRALLLPLAWGVGTWCGEEPHAVQGTLRHKAMF